MWQLPRLAISQRISLSAVERILTKHGLRIITSNPLTEELRLTLTNLEKVARQQGDRDIFMRLDERVEFQPVNVVMHHTTLSVFDYVRARMGQLARDFGLHLADVALGCCLVSVQTLPDLGGYGHIVDQDVERWWQAVRRRLAFLTM
jgi:hypothetical protein